MSNIALISYLTVAMYLAHIHNGRMNGFFMKDNDDIYLFIWSRGMPRIYQYHMNNNRAEEVFLDPPLKGSCVDFCFDVYALALCSGAVLCCCAVLLCCAVLCTCGAVCIEFHVVTETCGF